MAAPSGTSEASTPALKNDPLRLRAIAKAMRLPELIVALASSLLLTIVFSAALLLLITPAARLLLATPLIALLRACTVWVRPGQPKLLEWFWSTLTTEPLHAYIAAPVFPGVLTGVFYWLACLPYAAVDLLALSSFKKQYKLQPAASQRPDAWAHALGLTAWHHIAFILPGLATQYFTRGPWMYWEAGADASRTVQNTSASSSAGGHGGGGWCMEACDGLSMLTREAPPLDELCVHLLLCFVVFDAIYFSWHRLHHLSPLLYKHVHAVHHEYRAPFAWVTQHEHILELLPVSVWSVLVPIGLRCHPLTQWLFMLGATQASVEAHSGYNLGIGRALELALGPVGFVSWSSHHDNHHKTYVKNFEPFFTYLDKVCGSLLDTPAAGSGKR